MHALPLVIYHYYYWRYSTVALSLSRPPPHLRHSPRHSRLADHVTRQGSSASPTAIVCSPAAPGGTSRKSAFGTSAPSESPDDSKESTWRSARLVASARVDSPSCSGAARLGRNCHSCSEGEGGGSSGSLPLSLIEGGEDGGEGDGARWKLARRGGAAVERSGAASADCVSSSAERPADL